MRCVIDTQEKMDLKGEVNLLLVEPFLGGHPLELPLVHKPVPVLIKQPVQYNKYNCSAAFLGAL
jgi:hypothetical protein